MIHRMGTNACAWILCALEIQACLNRALVSFSSVLESVLGPVIRYQLGCIDLPAKGAIPYSGVPAVKAVGCFRHPTSIQ